MREYKHLQKSGPLHVNLKKILLAAVRTVLTQVRPETDKPCKDNASLVRADLLPFIKKYFGIQKQLKAGSPQYIEKLIKDDTYRFADCILHDKIMSHHIMSRKNTVYLC